MTRIAMFLALLPTLAAAGEVEIDGLVITHRNANTSGAAMFEDFTFDLPEGSVVVSLYRRGEACKTRPSCPDTLSVTSLPLGWRAEPMEVTTPELLSREIVLIPYAGF